MDLPRLPCCSFHSLSDFCPADSVLAIAAILFVVPSVLLQKSTFLMMMVLFVALLQESPPPIWAAHLLKFPKLKKYSFGIHFLLNVVVRELWASAVFG